MIKEKKLKIYQTQDGKEPYTEWFENLKDTKARYIIDTRLHRIQLGNFGDTKSIGKGIFELRIHFGAGYRIYFGQKEEEIVLVLFAGNKRSQKRDILKAKIFWNEYKNANS